MPVSSATLRILITRTLWIGAGLLPLLALTGLLWVWLAALGDEGGAAATRGILCVVASCLGLDLATLVCLLSAAALRLLERDEANR